MLTKTGKIFIFLIQQNQVNQLHYAKRAVMIILLTIVFH